MSDDITLSDIRSGTWKRLEARMRADLEKARSTLEGQGLDEKPIHTARLRERIAVLRSYLGISVELIKQTEPKPKPEFQPESDLY